MTGFSTIETNKMNTIQSSLEKSIALVMEHLKKYPEFDTFDFSVDMNKKRESEWEALQIKFANILGPLGHKIKLIKEKKFADIVDFKQFKREMIDIQESIRNLKHETKSKIDLLEKERLAVSEDISFYNEKLVEWIEPINTNVFANSLKPKTIKNRHKCKEVKEFMDFLHSTGGHENGWRKEDHLLFLKLRNKHKNIDIIAKNLHDQLPDISIQEIEKHEEWYKKYLNLQKRKKEAIKSWQKSKVDNKTQIKPYSITSSKIINVEKSEENIRERLIKWKTEKEEKLKSAKELEMCEEQKRKQIDLAKRKQQEEIKKVVQEWKQSRQIMEKQEIALKRMFEEQEKKRRAAEANKMIKEFQTQDDMYISKIKQQKKQEITPQIRSKSSSLAKRDPKRLMKPTRQWINRVHDENNYSNEFSTIMDLKSVPKLSVPEWRRQLPN